MCSICCRMSYLNTEVTPIHVIAQEEIARLRRVATDFKQLHEIVVLTMNITAYSDGCIHFQKVGFRLQDLCAFPYDP